MYDCSARDLGKDGTGRGGGKGIPQPITDTNNFFSVSVVHH